MAEGRSPKPKKMKKEENLDAMRERLYSRDAEGASKKRTQLTENSKASDVQTDWGRPAPSRKRSVQRGSVPQASRDTVAPPPRAEESSFTHDTTLESMPRTRASRQGYRMKVVLGGLIFFTVMLILSGMFLIWGNNSISAANISIDVSGPFAVGGGEEVALRIAISNQNTVAIESATLIIEYPPGTQSADGEGKELFTERQQLQVMESGEVHNVSAKARVFGEENEEKTIKVSIEYRVAGSNATFYKEAEPYRLKISSSPVVIDIDAVQVVSSGQEVGITMTVSSNSPTPIQNLLIKADYPFGFDYSSAEPSPSSGNSTWLIEELAPEEQRKITVTGILSGQQDEEKVFDISGGIAAEGDRLALASVFTKNTAEIAIEAPFLGIDVEVNGDDDDVVIVGKGQTATVRVTFTNTLDDTIYDGGIEVSLSGNALNSIDVDAGEGFYNSSTRILTFDSVSVGTLKEIAPGRSNSVTFTLRPDSSTGQTPEVNMNITARGNRTFEDRVPQTLVATASRVLRVASSADLSSSVSHVGGPTPPVAESQTTYAVTLTAASGSNDLTGVEVTAVLPQYVTWLDSVSGGDAVTYNASSRTLTWSIGSLSSNRTDEARIELGLTPSLSQVGSLPTLIETQRLRATDRFTNTTVRADTPALTTVIDGDNDGGRVEAP